jgi:hypothetical protein
MRVRQGTTFRRHAVFGAARERGSETEPSEPLPTPPPPPPVTPQLEPGQQLTPGQWISSRGGASHLVHQTDGNVVIYTNGQPVWSTNTYGTATATLSMQPDGNLVLYAAEGSANALWSSGTWEYPGSYARVLDVGELQIIAPGGAVVFSSRPAPAPAPPEASPFPPGFPGGDVLGEALEIAKRIVVENMAILAEKVGPIPFPKGNLTAWRQEVIDWSRKAYELAQTDPDVARAYQMIAERKPPDGGGLFGAIEWVKDKVVGAVKAVGTVIEFVAGDLPSPDDYDPENLIVTAYTNPIKFALLSGVAALVFPPALLYMGSYLPPNPLGLTAALGVSYARGGGKRVVQRILEPIGEHFGEMLNVAIDFALNREVALVRWALRKIAERLGDGVPKGIILALAEAADSVVDAIKNITALKNEAFYIGVGGAIEKIADRFTGGLQEALKLAGQAIQAGGAAVSIILDKGLAGLKEAKDTLLEGLIGIPSDFASFPERVQAEIAKAKVAGIAMASALAQNLRQGIDDLAKAAENIPGSLRDLAGTLLSLVGRLSDEVNEFLGRLMELAAIPEDQLPAPAPAPAPTSSPDAGSDSPAPTGGGMSKILAIGAGGLVGALIGGGPIGAVVGAAGAAALAKD